MARRGVHELTTDDRTDALASLLRTPARQQAMDMLGPDAFLLWADRGYNAAIAEATTPP